MRMYSHQKSSEQNQNHSKSDFLMFWLLALDPSPSVFATDFFPSARGVILRRRCFEECNSVRSSWHCERGPSRVFFHGFSPAKWCWYGGLWWFDRILWWFIGFYAAWMGFCGGFPWGLMGFTLWECATWLLKMVIDFWWVFALKARWFSHPLCKRLPEGNGVLKFSSKYL